MSECKPVVAGEGYREGDQPARQVGGQGRDAEEFDASHGDSPMGGCGGASDSNEGAYLLQQGAHESRGDKEVKGIAMSKRIVVCGDDFGMNADIDEGMIALAGMGRLSAVSCLALGPSFAVNARRLAPLNVDIGLHVNFTESLMPGAEPMPTLSRLILSAYAGGLDAAWIDAQLACQFDAFEAAFGRAPDYVDGHQHVHQLPGIRERLLLLLKQRYGDHMPWLRQTAPGMQVGIPLKEALKARVIGALGSSALAREAQKDGMRTNRRLLGVYGFEGGKRRYADLLQNWLFNARDCDLVMCHPAMGSQDDCAMSRQRRAEFDVLASPKLGDWLNANGVHISRLPATAR